MSWRQLVASLLLPLTLGEVLLFPTFTCTRAYYEKDAPPYRATILCDSFCYTDYSFESGKMVMKRQDCAVPNDFFAHVAFYFKYGEWPSPQCLRDGRTLPQSDVLRVCCSKNNCNQLDAFTQSNRK